MFKKIKFTLDSLYKIYDLSDKLELIQMSLGRIEKRQANGHSLADYEYKVFSQWGEDGVIQRLIDLLPIANNKFIEIGTEDYMESNTRFLLQNNNWKGLIFECEKSHVKTIKNSNLSWMYSLDAIDAFVSPQNINQLISEHDFLDDIGLLSIDIDGMDYWVWDAIDCINPRIVICEYNRILGNNFAVSIPYAEGFNRITSHYSGLYWGASLPAFIYLGKRKGYTLVHCGSLGSNAFFVRNDLITNTGLKEYFPGSLSRFHIRESRDQEGGMTFLGLADARRLLADMPIIDLINMNELTIGALDL